MAEAITVLKEQQNQLRLAPFIPVSSVGVANTFNENHRVWVNLPSSLDSLSLCWLVITDSFGTRPPNRIITLIRSLLNEQFTAHKVLLSLIDKSFHELAAAAGASAVHALVATAASAAALAMNTRSRKMPCPPDSNIGGNTPPAATHQEKQACVILTV